LVLRYDTSIVVWQAERIIMGQQHMNIWITGAGSGIGEQLCRRYATLGHRVIISGRNADKLAQVAREFPDRVLVLPMDVTDDSAVDSTSDALRAQVPHLDLIILNAGTCEYIRAPDIDTALFRRVMDTNYFGIINAFRAALPLMKAAPERPHVAGVCSLAGFIGFPRAAAYGASKAAAAYVLNALRTDFGDMLDVTVINPGFVTTPMTEQNRFPMPFLISAEKAAAIMETRLRQRPMTLNFPRRLSGLLRLMQLISPLWYRQQMKSARSIERARHDQGHD